MLHLSESDRLAARDALADLQVPVRLLFFEQSIGCETCAPARRLVAELAELSPLVSVEAVNLVLEKDRAAAHRIDRVPAIAFDGPVGARIRFLGAPFGHEFKSLVEAVRLAASGDSELSAESKAQLQEVDRPLEIQVFVTPTCAHCPKMVALAIRLAIEHPGISATCIEATEYPDLVRRFNVNGVPKTIINDRIEILGAVPEADFVREVLRAAALPD